MTGCLDHQTLLDHVEGRLSGEGTRSVLAHLDECGACRELVAETVLASAFDRACPSAAELPSRTLDRYLLLGSVGSGAMGVVYAAYDPTLDRKVALKLLRAELSRGVDDLRGRLLREAQAMARLHHPNVITVFDVGTFGGRVFIAMEFIDGSTLSAWLREEKRSWRQVLDVLVAAGRGLAAAHHSDLVHRDFKPDNVLVSRAGRACVTDFGLARLSGAVGPAPVAAGDVKALVSPVDATMTKTGTLLGTPAYMAPEQMRGEPASASADVFSFCVTLWEAIYGVRPFSGDTLYQLERAIAAGELVEGDTSPPSWLRRVVKKGLAARPADRPPSMDALLRELGHDPVGRRRRLVAAGGVLLAGGLAWALAPRSHAELCRGAERKLAGVWDESRRKSVAAAFASAPESRRPLEARFAGALDGYAGQWVAAHTAACEATRLRGEQSEELLDLRMACLDDRLRHVGALVGLVEKGTPQALDGSVRAALSLPALSECANTVALRAEAPPPADAARVEEVRRKLAEAEQRLNTRDQKAGLEAAQAALETARTIGYQVGIAEGLRLLGRFQSRASQHQQAGATMLELLAAAETARSDRLLARAALDLAREAQQLQQYDNGLTWNRLAEAAIHRLGGADVLEADRLYLAGALLNGKDKPDEARKAADKALVLVERLLGREHLTTGMTRQLIATIAIKQKRFEEAVANLLLARAIYVKQLGSGSDVEATALACLAGTYFEQGQFEEALAVNREALAMAEARLGPDHLDVGRYLVNIGTALVRMRRWREALPALERARPIYEKHFPPSAEHRAVLLASTGEAWAGLDQWGQALPPLEGAVSHPAYTVESYREEAIGTRMALLRTLWESGRRPRAIELAKKTVGECAAAKLSCPAVDEWLRTH